MEVAAFHPPTPSSVSGDSSLWPSSSRRRARELPCIPLCGARTFLCPLRAHSGCLADSRCYFTALGGAGSTARRRRTPALSLRQPAGIAEDRQRRQVARRRAAAAARASQACARARPGRRPAGTKIALQVMPGRGSSACSSTAWPRHDAHFIARSALALLPEQLLPAEVAQQVQRAAASSHCTIAPPSSKIVSRSRRRPRRAALARDLGGMQRVDARLGAREGEPGERVEQVVQVVRPRLRRGRSRRP